MTNEVEKLMKLDFPVLSKKVPGMGYFVSVPDLPGCVGEGETLEEAMEDIEEAKEDWFEAALESGVDIPLPESEKEYNGQFLLRMPKSLHRAIAEEAAADNVSINHYLNIIITQNRAIKAYKTVSQSPWPRTELIQSYLAFLLTSKPKSMRTVIPEWEELATDMVEVYRESGQEKTTRLFELAKVG